MELFRANTEYNMYLFSVVGSDRKLKITPQRQYEARSFSAIFDGEVPVQQCEARKGRYSGSYFSLKRGAGRLDILIGDAGSM